MNIQEMKMQALEEARIQGVAKLTPPFIDENEGKIALIF